MTEAVKIPDFNSSIVEHARKDFPLLDAKMNVGQALDQIRREGVGERVIYFFAIDAEERLVGVLPTRRLLTAPLETRLEEIMVRRVVAIPSSATVLEACEFFVLYKFFAFPVVDSRRRVVGVIDVSLFAEEMLEMGEREEERRSVAHVADDVFEALGFHLAQVRGASPWRVFRYRFPWLLATVAAGTACALLAGAFETTLAGSLVIAFFLTMVLGLNEGVSMQSMTLTIQALRANALTRQWFLYNLRRELVTAVLLGLACGILVGAIVWVWRQDPKGAGVIGGSIAVSLVTACLFGFSVPSFLHWLKLDPKIAAGPVTLAATDFCALAFYFSLAWLVLG
ncbi:MAG TPA: magnesium transporter [Chthoniobacterales bacterium]|nr:magnesium transporter [Chthoniobacterales bacterium]